MSVICWDCKIRFEKSQKIKHFKCHQVLLAHGLNPFGLEESDVKQMKELPESLKREIPPREGESE